jgi:hypothetical protein
MSPLFCNDGNNCYVGDYIYNFCLHYHSWQGDCWSVPWPHQEALQTAALVSRAYLSSTLLEVELALAFVLFSWSGSLWLWNEVKLGFTVYPHSLLEHIYVAVSLAMRPGHLQHLMLVPWYRAPNLHQPEQACVSGIFMFLSSNFFLLCVMNALSSWTHNALLHVYVSI